MEVKTCAQGFFHHLISRFSISLSFDINDPKWLKSHCFHVYLMNPGKIKYPACLVGMPKYFKVEYGWNICHSRNIYIYTEFMDLTPF